MENEMKNELDIKKLFDEEFKAATLNDLEPYVDEDDVDAELD